MATAMRGRSHDDGCRTAAPRAGGRTDAGHATLLRLQASVGNNAVTQLVARKPAFGQLGIAEGSRFSSTQFLDLLKRNKHVPAAVKGNLAAQGRSGSRPEALVLQKKVPRLSDLPLITNWEDSFNAALKDGTYELTTATSRIEVDAKTGSFKQVVSPDLREGERLRFDLFSLDRETIFGWTVENTTNRSDGATRKIVAVVTEIEVVCGQARQTFKPDEDEMAEALLHEISAHAGQAVQHLPAEHQTGDVENIDEKVRELFQATADLPSGLGSTTKDIRDWLAAHRAPTAPAKTP
jgi:hypothetical protein